MQFGVSEAQGSQIIAKSSLGLITYKRLQSVLFTTLGHKASIRTKTHAVLHDNKNTEAGRMKTGTRKLR